MERGPLWQGSSPSTQLLLGPRLRKISHYDSPSMLSIGLYRFFYESKSQVILEHDDQSSSIVFKDSIVGLAFGERTE